MAPARLARGPFALWLTLVALLVLSPRVAFGETIVVAGLPNEPPRAGLVEALRIQLAGRAEIVTRPALAGESLAANTEAASALIVAERVKLVVWTERATDASGQTLHLLHIVGDRDGRVLVMLQRVDGAEDPDVDRALSLKVAEIFDAIMTAPEPKVVEPRALSKPPPSPPKLEPELPRVRLGFVGDVGGWGATGTDSAPFQGGVRFGVGVRLRSGVFLGELAAHGRAVSDLETTSDVGTVVTSEGVVGAALRLAGVIDFVALGGELVVAGRIVEAKGEAPGGNVGFGSAVVPVLSLAPQITFLLTSFLALRADVGVEIGLRHHRFTINYLPVMDLGLIRGVLGASVVVSTP